MTVQSPDAEGLIKAKEALAQGQNTEYGENHWGLVLPGSLLLLDEVAGGPLEMLPTLPPFCCPALSFPKHPCKEQRTAVSTFHSSC